MPRRRLGAPTVVDSGIARQVTQPEILWPGLDFAPYVKVDATLVRPSEQIPIVGTTAKLQRALGTAPKVRFETVLRILLAHDLPALGCDLPRDLRAGVGAGN